MKPCKFCGTELPPVGVMICPDCAVALERLVARKIDDYGFDYLDAVGSCPECKYSKINIANHPCCDCLRGKGNLSNPRDYFKPKENAE